MKAFSSRYVTLDLWDTILRRNCHPDEVKLFTAQRLLLLLSKQLRSPEPSVFELLSRRQEIERNIGRKLVEKGYDDEYEIEEVLYQYIVDHAAGTLLEKEIASIQSQLVVDEIEHEKRITYLDQDLIQLLQASSFEKLFVVSDFYMSAEKVKKILSSHSFPFTIEEFFISCDCGLNKRSGRIFDHVCTKIGVPQSSILHIGDNEIADVKMAAAAGLQSLYFYGNTGEAARKIHLERFESRMEGSRGEWGPMEVRTSFHREKKDGGSSEGELLYNYGRELSPIFVGFSLFIQEKCFLGGHELVHFFTREGRFFKEVFDRVQKYGLFGTPRITSKILPISRLASFFPSLKDITLEEMQRLWSQYHTQSITSCLNSLGVEVSQFSHIFNQLGLDPERQIERPWQDESFLSLFSHSGFQALITTLHREQKDKSIRFFQEQDFGRDGRACIVDIGWRGTIQDNLARLYPDIDIDGCYLGLQEFFNAQPENTRKYGYIADANKTEEHVMLIHVMPYEMLCFSTGGSCVGYSQGGNGRMTAVYQIDDEEDQIHNQRMLFFQQGVTDGADEVCRTILQRGISLAEVQIKARELASDFLLHPPKPVCNAFNHLKQDDTFGMSRTIFPGNKGFKLRDRLFSLVSEKHRISFLKDLEESGWPQCMLRTRYGGFFHYLGTWKRKVRRS